MRNAITLLLLLLFPLLLSAQNQQSKDSIQKVFDLVFEKLEADYLHRKEIDWEIWKQKIYPKALASPSLDSALHFSSMIFDSIACNHCMIFSPESYFSSSLNQALEQEDFSSNFLLKYEQEPGFEAKLIQEEFGYILIPGMLLLDADQDSLNRVAQHMYDKILSLSKAHEIKGWVIDLRFNIGGNLYPMLAALYHLLGDAVVYTE
ncbi:MAG: S41 family peptidase, partial [Bacteroidota bacterium]